MHKISISPQSMLRPSVGIGRRNSIVSTTRKTTEAKMVSNKNLKKSPSANSKSLGLKNRKKLEPKSSMTKKPSALKTDIRPKGISDLSLRSKIWNHNPSKPMRKMSVIKEDFSMKKSVPKKEIQLPPKKPEFSAQKYVKPTLDKKIIRNKSSTSNTISSSDKSIDTAFKKKFDSILNKSVKEPKFPTFSLQKTTENNAGKAVKKTNSSSSKEQTTLQIETWGAPQPPKPVFNVSKNIYRPHVVGTIPERKPLVEKTIPGPEKLMKRISKPKSKGPPKEKKPLYKGDINKNLPTC